jgi:hypothetical protein
MTVLHKPITRYSRTVGGETELFRWITLQPKVYARMKVMQFHALKHSD